MRSPSQGRRSLGPTIRDVARRAQVSAATVSNVLSGQRFVKPELRKRVHEAVEALDYRPNRVAASLRNRRSRVIGMLVPDITNAFFAGIVRRVEELADADGYQIMLANSRERPDVEQTRLDALLARQVDGLIVIAAGSGEDAATALMRERVPMVFVDRAPIPAAFDTVLTDNRAAARTGTEHLLALGHTNIAVLVTDPTIVNIGERIAGYEDAMAAAGLATAGRVVVGGLTEDSAEAALGEVLAGDAPPTAVFAATNVMTLAAIRALRAADIDFPARLSVLGFDDFTWMRVLSPFVSTMVQPVDGFAREAWRLLQGRLSGHTGPPVHEVLDCTLAVRDSTVPPPA